MDVSELRSAFTLADSVTERVRQFRNERIARVRGNKTPVPLVAGASRTILHCIPLESFSRSIQYDVVKYSRQSAKFPPIIKGSGWSSRINLDGFVVFSPFENGSISYSQLFRNGTIEAVETYWLNLSRGGGSRAIPHVLLEQEMLEYLGRLFDIQKELGVDPPIAVALSLTETMGLEMACDVYSFDRGSPITEDNLVLPEVVVESFDENPVMILRPLFDLIWNACGYAKSKNFDDKGNWIGR